jgi:hypothetical protein
MVEKTAEYQYSRRLAPWCFDDEGTQGTITNKFFWGCAMNNTRASVRIANYTKYEEMVGDVSNHISSYTSEQDIGYAVVRPSEIDGDIDWSGKSYAVSTKCDAIPQDACTLGRSNITDSTRTSNCPGLLDGKNRTIYFAAVQHALWFYDWHRDLSESAPFTASFDDDTIKDQGLRIVDNSTITGATPEDTNKMFRNPWRWLAGIGVPGNTWDLPQDIQESPSLWAVNAVSSRFVLSCSTTGKSHSSTSLHRPLTPTVWDVDASFASKRVLSLTATPSNGSVTGIASMPSARSVRRIIPYLTQSRIDASKNLSTPQEFVTNYELAMSKVYASWLSIHTVPAPAHLVQKRITKVITKLPVAALWLLIIANLLYALFAIILTILALRASSPEVHQVYTRLTTTGVAAQLFDWKHSRGPVERDFDLFSGEVRKRVGVKVTETGGAEFVSYEVDAPRDIREQGREEAQWELVNFKQDTAYQGGSTFR